MLGLGGYDLETAERLRFSYSNEDSFADLGSRRSSRSSLPALATAMVAHASTTSGVTAPAMPSISATVRIRTGIPAQDLIVFKGCNASGANCGLWTMAPDGSNRQRLTENANDARPVWSRTGDAVIFMSNERDGNWELYRLDVADGSVTRLTDNPANDGLPAVSPDGSRIAFMSDRGGVWTIQTMPIDGGPAQTLHTIGDNVADWLSQGIAWER